MNYLLHNTGYFQILCSLRLPFWVTWLINYLLERNYWLPLYHVVWVIEKEAAAAVAAGTAVAVTAAAATPAASAGASTADATPKTGRSGRGRGGRKKAKVPTEPPAPAIDLELPVDPNEPTYCFCNQVSYGEMVACDNPNCKIEWYHIGCVGVKELPKGKWYCPSCVGFQKKRKGKWYSILVLLC